jgi:hypothetical protein
MNTRSLVALSLAVAVFSAAPAAAASPSWPPSEGDRVRLSAGTLSDGPVVAQVLGVEGEELMLRIPPLTTPVRVPADTITRLEVSRGTHRQAGKGALVGAGGVTVFLVALIALACDGDCWDSETTAIIGKAALAGGLAGAAVGTAFTREVWVPMAPTVRPRVGLAQPDERQLRPQFAVTLRF